MPRSSRLILDNATYHVMIRGNQKQLTFFEDSDFQKFITLIKHYKKKLQFKLYGYCLMPNHVHLILEIKKGYDLVKVMQGLNQTYTIWFNKKYNKVGHLWQGRYKSMIIQKNSYLLGCIEYVELNPARANLIESPFDYAWSSCQERTGHKKCNLLDKLEFI